MKDLYCSLSVFSQAGVFKTEGTPAGSSCWWSSGSADDVCLPGRWKNKAIWFSFFSFVLIMDSSVFVGLLEYMYVGHNKESRTEVEKEKEGGRKENK